MKALSMRAPDRFTLSMRAPDRSTSENVAFRRLQL